MFKYISWLVLLLAVGCASEPAKPAESAPKPAELPPLEVADDGFHIKNSVMIRTIPGATEAELEQILSIQDFPVTIRELIIEGGQFDDRSYGAVYLLDCPLDKMGHLRTLPIIELVTPNVVLGGN